MKKRIFANLLILLLVVTMVIPTVFAENKQESYGNSTVYMHDLGDLLSDSEEYDLMTEFGDMCEDISYNVLLLTTNDADGKSTMTWTDDYMDDLFPSAENNIAFVIDMDNREIYINTMGNALLCLTDSMINYALDDGYEYIVDSDYYNCLYAMGEYCLSRLSDDPPENGVFDDNGDGYDDNSTGALIKEGAVNGIIPGAVITGILCVCLVIGHNKANKVQSATTYMSKENYSVEDKNEVFVKSYERVHHDYYKPKSSSSGGGRSGGGSSHSSSSGRSHGGGGRSF